jgi:hypothetical protein
MFQIYYLSNTILSKEVVDFSRTILRGNIGRESLRNVQTWTCGIEEERHFSVHHEPPYLCLETR